MSDELMRDWRDFAANLPDGTVEWACAGPFIITWGNAAAAHIEAQAALLREAGEVLRELNARA